MIRTQFYQMTVITMTVLFTNKGFYLSEVYRKLVFISTSVKEKYHHLKEFYHLISAYSALSAGPIAFCVQTHRILRKFKSNSACKREQSHACMNFVERKQDRSAAAILRANHPNTISL